MAVALATLTPMKNGGPDNSRKITAQFNPQSLRLSFRNLVAPPTGQRLTDGSCGGSGGSAAKQSTGFVSTLNSLEFLFDTTETGADVRVTTLKIIRLLQLPGTNAAPLVQFQWGSFLFNGTISSIEETIDYFSEAGVPLRATLTLSMENNEPQLDNPIQTAGAGGGGFGAGIGGGISGGFGAGISGGISGGISAGFSAGASVGTTPLTVAPEGVSLQGLAAGAGMDWKAVATANNVDNPRAVAAGTVLNLNVGAQARISGG